MNKTINVNIGGRIFNIEEEAYERLEKYLKAIRGYFERHRSADEIVSDIELRISELFEERINDSKQVIVISDVEEVISIMGRPEDYVDPEDEEESAEFTGRGRTKFEKRVFRDPDNKILFGVCGGLSSYLGWDPIILRALFVIFTITWGIGPVIYIILALIIPKAKTTAEKLQMRGEPVTVENISKKVNESFEGVKEDLKDFGDRNDINSDRINNAGRHVGEIIGDFFEALGRAIKIIATILVKITGVILFLAGAFGITFLLATLVGWESIFTAGQSKEFVDLLNASFTGSTQKWLFFSGISLFMGIPALALLLLGIRLLFNNVRFSGYLALGLVIAWFVGVGLLTASGVNAFRDYRVRASFTERVNIDLPNADTLILSVEGADLPRYEFSDDILGRSIFFDGSVTIPGVDSTNIMYVGNNELTIRKSPGSEMYLEVEKTSRGASQKDALSNARGMKTSLSVSGDTLRVLPYFVLEKGEKIRGQEAEYTLYVPEGKAIHFAPGSERVIYDIPNVSNTWDRDMIGKTWEMTEKGLKCSGCPEINREYEQDQIERERELLQEQKEEEEERLKEIEERLKEAEEKETEYKEA